jgi:hypothetical protein
MECCARGMSNHIEQEGTTNSDLNSLAYERLYGLAVEQP